MIAPALRFPAEWEPQSAVILAWPHAGTDWAPRLAQIETSYLALVAAIVRFQSVVICVADAALGEHAAQLLNVAGVPAQFIRYVEVDYDDTWLRDSGPITLLSEPAHHDSRPEVALHADRTTHVWHPPSAASAGTVNIDPHTTHPRAPMTERFALLDFHFNAWGDKYVSAHDDRLVEALFTQGLFKDAQRDRINFALEGGAIETDGDGTLLCTWQCLHTRHPELDRSELSSRLAEYLHQRRVLWLDHGALEGDDTDAHIDTLARFCATDAIVYQTCDDPHDAHYDALRCMRDELAALRAIDGKPYRLFALPWAKPIIDEGRRLAASYANFLIVNGAVLMPAYDDPADAIAASVLEKAFPHRQVVPVPCRPLIWQNGSLHCLTMQLPQGVV